MYSASQTVFFLLFFTLLFLLLIFGETTPGIPLLGGLVLLLLLFHRQLKITNTFQTLVPVALMGLLTLFSLLSLITTISFPFTLYSSINLSASFLLFLFVIYRDRVWMPNAMLLLGSVVLSIIFAVMTVFYTFSPQLQTFLPSSTLLTSYFGHNQAVTLFLLILPLVWSLAERERKKVARLGVVIILLALLLSFSRVGILLGAVEVLVLWRTTMDKKLRRVGGLFFGVILSVGVIFLVLSFSSRFLDGACPVLQFKDQLCKSIHTELRPAYWSQAIRAWQQRPLTGWGAGTFALLSPRFQEHSGEYSGYAHNEYLQMFTELGVLGGMIFLGFTGWLLLMAVRALHSPQERVQFGIGLGTVMVLFQALFDFNFHMVGLWLVFLLLTGVWITEQKIDLSAKSAPFLARWNKVVRLSFFTLGSIVVLWAGLYVISVGVWRLGDKQRAVQLFPFAFWRVEDLLVDSHPIDEKSRQYYLWLYDAHYRVWVTAASAAHTSAADKAKFLEKANQLDPLSQERQLYYLQAVYESKDWSQFEVALEKWRAKLIAGKLQDIEYDQHREVAAWATEAGDSLFESDKDKAVRFYQLGYEINPNRFYISEVPIMHRLNELSRPQLLNLLETVEFGTVARYDELIYQAEALQLQRALIDGDIYATERLVTVLLKQGHDWGIYELVKTQWQSHKTRLSSSAEELKNILLSYQKAIETWETGSEEKRDFDRQTVDEVKAKIETLSSTLHSTN